MSAAMFDRGASAWPREAGAESSPHSDATGDREPDPPDELLRLAATCRAEAERWERLAGQISLLPDRAYFLSLAAELRAKAAALEARAEGSN
jgi:hypothetical protein